MFYKLQKEYIDKRQKIHRNKKQRLRQRKNIGRAQEVVPRT